jgi:hypothetical protein
MRATCPAHAILLLIIIIIIIIIIIKNAVSAADHRTVTANNELEWKYEEVVVA